MSTPTTILEQLMRDEGLRLKPYVDTTGNVTIGYGHNLTAKGISEATAEVWLSRDAATAEQALRVACPWAWKQLGPSPRFYALVNMVFNLGIAGFIGFGTFVGLMSSGEYDKAAADLRTTLAYRQNTERYERLRRQIETDTWQ